MDRSKVAYQLKQTGNLFKTLEVTVKPGFAFGRFVVFPKK